LLIGKETVVGITHTLKHDHRVIEQCLRALDGVCARLERGEHVPTETLDGIYDFIATYAEGYHRGKEEKHMIPALVDHGIVVSDSAIEHTLNEHAAELEVLKALGGAIRGFSDGKPDAGAQVAIRGREYVAILTGHFEKEDTLLFRLVDEVLPEDVRDALAFEFQQAEVELGSGGRRKYEELARGLERDWAI
jgi:hemerythrin-like domain-containing protein